MPLLIEEAENGYILRSVDEDREWPYVYVVENYGREVDVHLNEARCTLNLLYAIIEYFEIGGSKHDPARIEVRIYNPQTGKEIDPRTGEDITWDDEKQ